MFRPFYRSALAAVVPLRVGGGGKQSPGSDGSRYPVISTTLGAEGLVTASKDILLADSPEAIADAVTSLQANSTVWQDLVTNARALVRAQYDLAGHWGRAVTFVRGTSRDRRKELIGHEP